jgi:hypothetical protein
VHTQDAPTRTRHASSMDRRTGTQGPVRLRRPAARMETGAQDRQADPDPPANGKAPRTWCVCRWPNSVAWQHASPVPGRSVPTSEPSQLHARVGSSLQSADDGDEMTDETKMMAELFESYVRTVTRCPPGEPKAPNAREYGQAQLKRCRCGHAGTMPYPKLFKRLRRRRPLTLRCQRCGRVLR